MPLDNDPFVNADVVVSLRQLRSVVELRIMVNDVLEKIEQRVLEAPDNPTVIAGIKAWCRVMASTEVQSNDDQAARTAEG